MLNWQRIEQTAHDFYADAVLQISSHGIDESNNISRSIFWDYWLLPREEWLSRLFPDKVYWWRSNPS